jgi:hypothetical protein
VSFYLHFSCGNSLNQTYHPSSSPTLVVLRVLCIWIVRNQLTFQRMWGIEFQNNPKSAAIWDLTTIQILATISSHGFGFCRPAGPILTAAATAGAIGADLVPGFRNPVREVGTDTLSHGPRCAVLPVTRFCYHPKITVRVPRLGAYRR